MTSSPAAWTFDGIMEVVSAAPAAAIVEVFKKSRRFCCLSIMRVSLVNQHRLLVVLCLVHRTTNDEQRTTNNEQRTTNNEQRTTNNEQRTTNNEQRTHYLLSSVTLERSFFRFSCS